MKLEINMPKEFIKDLYDILVQTMDTKESERLDVPIDFSKNNFANYKDKLTLFQELTEEIQILDITTDILADELRKEGAL